ncbi:MAG: glycosyltransferase [Thermodesulfobacteriota bacterium]
MPSTTSRPAIAYIVNSLNLGGTEQLVVKMSLAFRREYSVQVICLDEPGIWATNLRKEGIPVHCLWRQPGLDLRMAGKIARFCSEQRISLIHAHQCTPWFYGGLSRLRNSKPKLLFEEHGRFYPEIKNRKKKLFNRLVLQPLTERIVAVSQDVRNRLHLYEGLALSRIEVVYNGTSPLPGISAEERNRLRQEFGFTEKDLIFGTVGRFDPIKNLPLFLRGFSAIKGRYPEAKGFFVGNGPDFAEVQSVIRDSSLEQDVILTGYRADAARLIQIMDVFVLCSFSEGTSMALLEAMAAGVPAIVTQVGGNPEIVLAGETGWQIPSDDDAAMAAAMADAMTDASLRKKMGEKARERFESFFTFDRMLASYGVIYQEMLDIG